MSHIEKETTQVSQLSAEELTKKTLVSVAAAAVVSMALASTTAQAVPDQPQNWEKCTGVSKKGHNDCGSTDGKHKCGGMAPADDLTTEWIYVPEGTCKKLTGGKVIKVKPAKNA